MTAHPIPGSNLILSSGNTRVYAAGKVVSVVHDATVANANTWTYLSGVIPEGYRPATTLYNIAFDNGNRLARIVVDGSGRIGSYVLAAGARLYGTVTYIAE